MYFIVMVKCLVVHCLYLACLVLVIASETMLKSAVSFMQFWADELLNSCIHFRLARIVHPIQTALGKDGS